MTFIAVRCPHCHSKQIVKRGKTRRGTQRYLCPLLNVELVVGQKVFGQHNPTTTPVLTC